MSLHKNSATGVFASALYVHITEEWTDPATVSSNKITTTLDKKTSALARWAGGSAVVHGQ
jgi:hypothetical protein